MDPPAELRLDAGAVSRINWQPRWCPPPLECIASRRGPPGKAEGVLELVFAWDSKRQPLAHARFRYCLEPVGNPCLDVVVARRIT